MAVAVPSREEGAVVRSPLTAAEAAALRADDVLARLGYRRLATVPFMLFFGPISSVFDFITFGVMLWVFHVGPALFRSGWFVESLATQTLVIFAIRTFYPCAVEAACRAPEAWGVSWITSMFLHGS